MDQPTFVAAFGGTFEHSPWVAERAFGARPFASVDALHAAMVVVVAAASREEQLTLLRAHPDLAGKKGKCKCGTIMPVPVDPPGSARATATVPMASSIMSRT